MFRKRKEDQEEEMSDLLPEMEEGEAFSLLPTDDEGGQLAIDAYQENGKVIVKAPIAGVDKDDIDVSIIDDTLTIRGQRKESKEVSKDDYFYQECYWGSFSRSVKLPVAVDPDKAEYEIKNGILVIALPTVSRAAGQVVKIKHKGT